MSDYTIIGASAAFNPENPAEVDPNSSVNITVSLLFSGTIVDPIELTAQATIPSADQVTWDQFVTDTVTAATLEFTVTATAGPSIQPVSQYRQNYLVTLTDGDARTQVFNIALDNEDGYPTVIMDEITGYPSPATVLSNPDTPTDITLLQISDTEYLLTWTSTGEAVTGFNIARALKSGTTTGTFAELVDDTGTTATAYSDTGLTSRSRYVYKVAAINVLNGVSEFSADSATIAEAPSALSASPTSVSEIDLSWTAPSDSGGTPLTGYRIERESPTGGGFSVLVADTGTTAAMFSDSGLSASTEYNYRVSALNVVGVSRVSTASAATTLALTVPDAPTGLTATAVSASQIDLAWVAPAYDGGTPITGYMIERESPVGGGFSTLVADTGDTMTSYSDMGLTTATQYNYRVSAINGIGTSGTSNEANDTTF